MIRAASDPDDPAHAVPSFATSTRPRRLFAEFVRDAAGRGRRVVLASASPKHLRTLVRQAEAAAQAGCRPAADWQAVRAAPPGALLSLSVDLDAGFVDDVERATVVAAADLLGSRAREADEVSVQSLAPESEAALGIGDTVVHLDHGLGLLRGLETVT